MKPMGCRQWSAAGKSPPDWELESGRFLGQSGLRIWFGGKGPVAIDPQETRAVEKGVFLIARRFPKLYGRAAARLVCQCYVVEFIASCTSAR
jgi:hypothetical protein